MNFYPSPVEIKSLNCRDFTSFKRNSHFSTI